MSRNPIRTLAIAMAAIMLALGFCYRCLREAVAQAGQQPAAAFKAPDTIDFRSANIISEACACTRSCFTQRRWPASSSHGIMAHGWGGTAAGFRRDAIGWRRRSYLAITFDYRGWEKAIRESSHNPAPAKKDGLKFTAEVLEVARGSSILGEWLRVGKPSFGRLMGSQDGRQESNRLRIDSDSGRAPALTLRPAIRGESRLSPGPDRFGNSRPKAIALAAAIRSVKLAYDEATRSRGG